MNKHLYITILAGGAGTRFWPASSKNRPKQLLPLATSQPMLTETVRRALTLVPAEQIRILTTTHLSESIQDLVRELPPQCFKIEPLVRGTAAALTWAAWDISQEDPEAVILSLHADHVIEPESKFAELIQDVLAMATAHKKLFTVAVNPDRPETGYGYIERGKPLETDSKTSAFEVVSFQEKPDLETVKQYLKEGYLWNSGIFLWRAKDLIDEIRTVTPELSQFLFHLESNRPADFFNNIPMMSVDEGILERSGRVATALADFHWDDVGTWSSLSRVRPKDESGNVLMGKCKLVDTKDSVIYSEDMNLVTYGIKDLVLVQAGDTVLATTKDLASDLKTLIDHITNSSAQEE